MIWRFIGEKLTASLERYRENGLIIEPTTEDFITFVEGCRLDTVLSNLQKFVHEYIATVVAYSIMEKMGADEPPVLECSGHNIMAQSPHLQPTEFEENFEELLELLS